MQRAACRSCCACRSLSRWRPCWARCWSGRSTGHLYRQAASRPGAVFDRPRLHGRGGRGLRHGSTQQIMQAAGVAHGQDRDRHRRSGHGPLSAVHRRPVRVAGGRPAIVLSHALRQPPAGGGRRRRVARRPRHQRRSDLPRHVRVRLRPRRPGRCARRGNPRTRPDLPAQVHDLLPGGRVRRRNDQHHRARCWRRCSSASPTWRASTTSRTRAPSSSTAS